MQRAVFLDRDGVIDRAFVRDGKPYPPRCVEELDILPGVSKALARLRSAGFKLIVVTNQPDVARGTQTRAAVEEINATLRAKLPIDDFRVCYHGDDDKCECRKPKHGALLESAKKFGIDLGASFMIGDRWRDIEAGRNAGCTTVLIDYHYAEGKHIQPDIRVNTLSEAVNWILIKISKKGDEFMNINDLKVKIFADGADKAGMLEMYTKPYIKGFTTNPTLMRKAGIVDYKSFAKDILGTITDWPVSFEVFSDDFPEMERQAHEIAGWGKNVYVKIPVTNTRGEVSYDLVNRLTHAGIKVNVTALLTLTQVRDVVKAVAGGAPCCISVFAGRIADTGCDPVPIMAAAVELLSLAINAELIWASPRELLNIFQAEAIGCHIITATNDILKKLDLVGKNLTDYSLDTVKMFYSDAHKAGYRLT